MNGPSSARAGANSGRREAGLRTRSGPQPQLVRHYLKGRYHWTGEHPDDQLTSSARYFEAAHRGDPHPPWSMSGLVGCLHLAGDTE